MKARVKDTISYEDQEYEVMQLSYGVQELYIIEPGYKRVLLSEIEGKYTVTKKHYNKMEYMGATATVLSIAQKEGHIVYLELIGQEDMVKSITSVIMQGRVKMNDHWLNYSGGYFQVHSAGNKRMMQVLDKGIVHAIIYHAPSIMDTNFSVLIGPDEKVLKESFSNWMDLTNPMPYPKGLVGEIFNELKDREYLVELNADGVKAVSINDEVGQNEFEILREVIIKVSVEAGIVNEYDESLVEGVTYPLPKSKMLTDAQVRHIYDTLEKAPKTYETDGWKLKPVSVKLFGGPMTIYVTERDKSAGTIIDGEVQKQSQCFGYVDLGYGGEWGYLNFDEYIEANLEMDLHFEDKYLTQGGKIVDLEEIAEYASSLGVTIKDVIEDIGYKREMAA